MAVDKREAQRVRYRRWIANPENRKKTNAYHLELTRKYRRMAIEAYGGRCACCGIDEPTFLAFDHINDDGARHRREVRGRNMANWLVQNRFPSGFQLLCHNCNHAKRLGVCPHKTEN